MKKEILLTKRINYILILISIIVFTVTSVITAVLDSRAKKEEYMSRMHRTVEAYIQLISGTFEIYNQQIIKAQTKLYSKNKQEFYVYLNNFTNFSGQKDVFYILDKNNKITVIKEPYSQYLGFVFGQEHFAHPRQVHQSFISLHPVINLIYDLGDGNTLVIERDVHYLIRLMQRFKNVNVYADGVLFILNENGTVVYHPNKEFIDSRYNLGFMLKGLTVTGTSGLWEFSLQNQHMLSIIQPLTIPKGWTFYYALPYSLLFNSFLNNWFSNLILMAVLLSVMILLLRFLIGYYVTGPVSKIVNQLERIRTGEEDVKIKTGQKKNIREITLITNALNLMTRNIRQSQEQLRKREEILKTVTDNSLDWSYWLLNDKTLAYTSPNALKITGYTADEFYNDPTLIERIIHPDDLPLWNNHTHEESSENEMSYLEIRIIRKDGSVRWIRHICQEIVDESGKSLGIRGSNNDITLRKQAELAFHEQRDQLETTLRSIGDGVIATDVNKKIILINHSAEKLTGWKSEEALNKDIQEVLQLNLSEEDDIVTTILDRVLAEGRAIEYNKNILLVSRNKEEHLISDSAAPIFNDKNEISGIVIVFRDVSERVRMHEELAKMNKLESVGVLAGGIAHDFNNILTAILGNVMLASELEENEKIKHRLAEAEKAALRAKDLTDQLLTFSKGGNPILKPTSIKSIIEDSCSFALSGSKAKLVLNVAADLHQAYADAGQINQVLHNLVLNADQAIPDMGKIEVSAYNEEVAPGLSVPLKEGAYIKIIVQDNGVGIPENYLNKIFDPYFTTKKRGNGLGLSSVFSIIKKHNGHISAESESGSGTTFTLYLPASLKISAAPIEKSDVLNLKGNGRILVMDDEAEIREVLGELLNMSGYSPEFSEDGEQAIKMYEASLKQGDKYRAVIMDLTIPGGLGGKEAIGELRKLDKDVIAVVSSGYSNGPVMSRYKEYGFKAVVKKPFQLHELRNILTKVLG